MTESKKPDYREGYVTGCPNEPIGVMMDFYDNGNFAWPISGDATTLFSGHWRKEKEKV